MKNLFFVLLVTAQQLIAPVALAQELPVGAMPAQATEIKGAWKADVISLDGSEEVTLTNIRLEMSSPVFGQTVFHLLLRGWSDEATPTAAEQFACRHFGFSSVRPRWNGFVKKLDGDYVIDAGFEPDNSIRFAFRKLYLGSKEFPASVICIK